MHRRIIAAPRTAALAVTLFASALVTARELAAQTPTQSTARLSGYIREKANNELVRYAFVAVDGDSTRSQSDVDGFYYLNLTVGTHRIQVRAIGYTPLDTQITLRTATTRDLFLVRNAQLARIDITAAREKSDIDPASPDMSVSCLNLDIVRRAPAVL